MKGYDSSTTWSGQAKFVVPATNITASSKISVYGKAAFLAALAENGVEIEAYCDPYSGSYADESAARAGLKAYLTIAEE